MKTLLTCMLFVLLTSCSHVKVVWSADACEVGLINKCNSFCRTNHSKVEEFIKTDQYYQCTCVKDMEATFRNVCE